MVPCQDAGGTQRVWFLQKASRSTSEGTEGSLRFRFLPTIDTARGENCKSTVVAPVPNQAHDATMVRAAFDSPDFSQALLGHSNVSMTEHYAKVSESKAIEAARLAPTL